MAEMRTDRELSRDFLRVTEAAAIAANRILRITGYSMADSRIRWMVRAPERDAGTMQELFSRLVTYRT